MAQDLQSYHQQRADQCRALAEQARDPEVRRRHEQLAALHIDHASRYAAGQAAGDLSPA